MRKCNSKTHPLTPDRLLIAHTSQLPCVGQVMKHSTKGCYECIVNQATAGPSHHPPTIDGLCYDIQCNEKHCILSFYFMQKGMSSLLEISLGHENGNIPSLVLIALLQKLAFNRAWPGSQPNAIDRGAGGRITPPRLTPKPMTAVRRARRRSKGLVETVLKHS